MERKTFIKTSCIACTSIGFLGVLLQSCTSIRYTTGSMNDNGLVVDLKEFATKKNDYRPYIIVRHDLLQYPVCVYHSKGNYTALLLRCSHQGAELQVSGDQLTCPAHGSEFDKLGKVTQGPAMNDLLRFPVSIINNQLFIDLRKQA